MRPGWQTTEFWMTLIVQGVAMVVLFKVIPGADQATVEGILSDGTTHAFALIGSMLSAWKYIKSRTEVKSNGHK